MDLELLTLIPRVFIKDYRILGIDLNQLRVVLNEVAKYTALDMVRKHLLTGKVKRGEFGRKWLELAQDLLKARIHVNRDMLKSQRYCIDRIKEQFILPALLVLSASFLVSSIPYSRYIDKTLMDGASYILESLPWMFYLGFTLTIITLGWSILSERKHIYIIAMLLFLLYLEYPRFLYPNAFQIEYFHQTQVYHVVNYGTVTDPGYSFPKSDVSHAIFTASYIMIAGLQKDFVVSYVVPLLVKIALLILAYALSIKLSEVIRFKLYRVLIMSLPLYILISDTEPLFINHCSYVLPLYLFLLYIISRRDLNIEPSSRYAHIILILLGVSSLTITHIYFSTAATLAIFVALLFNVRRDKTPTMSPYLLPIIVYAMWHGMVSEWSIGTFTSELRILSTAFTRLITFQLNPLKPLEHVEERFGTIPIKPDYQLYFMLKWLDVLILQGLMIILVISSILLTRRRLTNLLLRMDGTFFMLIAIIIFVVLVGTFIAHPQRILEHLVLTLAIFTIVIIRLTEHSKRTKWVKVIAQLIVFTIMLSAPLKLIHYWGTSLTYIGFPQKTIYMLSYFAQHTENPIDKPIHFVGTTPYWFLTEIVAHKQHFYPISLNGPEGCQVFEETLDKLTASVFFREPHYILIDLTTTLTMRSKYMFEPYIQDFIGYMMHLSLYANIVFAIEPTHMIWLKE